MNKPVLKKTELGISDSASIFMYSYYGWEHIIPYGHSNADKANS